MMPPPGFLEMRPPNMGTARPFSLSKSPEPSMITGTINKSMTILIIN
jgi:hypothetical protein